MGYCTVLYCTLLYCTLLYCTVQYSTVQYCTVQYSKIQYSKVQYSTVQYSNVSLSIKGHYRSKCVPPFVIIDHCVSLSIKVCPSVCHYRSLCVIIHQSLSLRLSLS